MNRKLLVFSALILFTSLAVAQAPAPAENTPTKASAPIPMKVGGDVLPPKLISSVEPKYPRPLFHKRKPSTVLVNLTVPVDGIPTNVHIVKSGGSAFDKNALVAVQKYRFQPATLHGQPVPCTINVEVNFKIF